MKVAVNHRAAADVDGGDVVVQGDLVGVAASDIGNGDTGRIWVMGIFNIVKATGAGTAISAGAKVYWDATSKVGTDSDGAGANKLIGKAVRDAQDGDRFVRTLLTP